MRNEKLVEARKKAGFTQEILARTLNCTKGTISNWENGYSSPSLNDAIVLSEVLGEDIKVLFLNPEVQVFHTKKSEKEVG